MKIVPRGTAEKMAVKQRVAALPTAAAVDTMTLPQLREAVKTLIAAHKELVDFLEVRGR